MKNRAADKTKVEEIGPKPDAEVLDLSQGWALVSCQTLNLQRLLAVLLLPYQDIGFELKASCINPEFFDPSTKITMSMLQ